MLGFRKSSHIRWLGGIIRMAIMQDSFTFHSAFQHLANAAILKLYVACLMKRPLSARLKCIIARE